MSMQTALVTGASSGIGETIAGMLAAQGYDLVLVARRQDRLDQLADDIKDSHNVDVTVYAADLSEGDAASKLSQYLLQRNIPIDLLVNNAGVMHHGDFVDMDVAATDRLINLNIRGMTNMLTAFVPDMVARGKGRVMNIASISAFWPVPQLAIYAASKAYVLSLTESLSEEYRDSGVTFTAVCPGITATPMVDQVQQKDSLVLPDFVIGDVNDVAKQAIDATLDGQVILVPGAANRLAVEATRMQPKWLLRKTIGYITRFARK